MSENPYRPPDSNLSPADSGPTRPVLGVVSGFIIDVGGTVVVTMLLAVVYSVLLASRGLDPEEIQATISATGRWSVYGLGLGAAGLAMSFLGGYSCSRIARARDLRPGLVLAALTALVGVAFTLESENLMWNLLLVAVGFLVTLFGAHRALERDEAVRGRARIAADGGDHAA